MNFNELSDQIPNSFKESKAIEESDFNNARNSLIADMAKQTIKTTNPIVLFGSLVVLVCLLIILIGGSVVLFMNYGFFKVVLSILVISVLTIYLKIKHNGKQRRKKRR